MTLSDDEKQAMRSAIEAVHTLNDALAALRLMKIACNIREHNDHWYLSANPIILREHYE